MDGGRTYAGAAHSSGLPAALVEFLTAELPPTMGVEIPSRPQPSPGNTMRACGGAWSALNANGDVMSYDA